MTKRNISDINNYKTIDGINRDYSSNKRRTLFNTSHIKSDSGIKFLLANLNNPNANSPAIRNLKIEFLLNKQLKKEELEKRIRKRLDQEQIKLMSDEYIERNDVVSMENLEIQKQKRYIKEFLNSKNNKLNKNEKNDLMFENLQDKINFLSDSYQVPHLKNRLLSEKKSKTKRLEMLNSQNVISKPVQLYLNSKKMKLQKAKDDLLAEKEGSKESNLEMKIREAFTKYFKQTLEDYQRYANYDYKDYFVFKYEGYSNVDFANDKVKNSIKKGEKYYNLTKKKKIFGSFILDIVNKMNVLQEVVTNNDFSN